MYSFTPPKHHWYGLDCMVWTFTCRLALRLTGSVFWYNHHTDPTGRGHVDLIELEREHCDALKAEAQIDMKGTKKYNQLIHKDG